MIKRASILVLTGCTLLYFVPTVVAQHGHGTGAGKGVGTGAGAAHRPLATKTSTGSAKTKASTETRKSAKADAGKKTAVELLDKNEKLSAKLQTLLPNTMTPQQACEGFKNLGQCVAAIHVSHNLGIEFVDLKEKMLGVTEGEAKAEPMSLGAAIHALKPDADSGAEAKKATTQASQDVKS